VRFNPRPAGGDSIQERPADQDDRPPLESGQAEPTLSDSIETHQARLIWRHVLVQACHDLTYGRLATDERDEVIKFAHSQWFVTICHWTGWDEHWFRELLLAIHDQDESVRRSLGTKTTQLLKRLAKKDLDLED